MEQVMKAFRHSTLVGATVLLGACLVSAAGPAQDTTLAVAGRANATPSIASTGSLIAIAWNAAAAGATDIYTATSRDGATTFGVPVRVNDVAGAASVSGEQPPRVVLIPHPGTEPSVVVTWTAK